MNSVEPIKEEKGPAALRDQVMVVNKARIAWWTKAAVVVGSTATILVIVVLLTPLPEEPLGLDPTAAPGGLVVHSGTMDQLNSPETPSRIFSRLPKLDDARLIRASLDGLCEELEGKFAEIPEALHIAASANLELRKTQKAEQMWKKCLESRPRFAGPYVGLASIQFERGDDELGIELLLQSRDRYDPTEEFYREIVRALERTGEVQKAEQFVLEGIQKFPNDGSLWYYKGLVEGQLDRLDSAESSLREAIRLGDSFNPCRQALAAVLGRVGKAEEAKELLKVPSNPVLANDTFQQDYEEKLKGLASFYFYQAALVAETNDRPVTAQNWLSNSISLSPKSIPPLIALSRIFRKQSRYLDAIEVQVRCVELEPDNHINHLNLSSLASQVGKHDLAQTTLEEAIARLPKVAVLKGELAILCLRQGEFEKSLKLSEECMEMEPRNVEWPIIASAACSALGRDVEKESYIKKAQLISPGDPRIRSLLSTVRSSQ